MKKYKRTAVVRYRDVASNRLVLTESSLYSDGLPIELLPDDTGLHDWDVVEVTVSVERVKMGPLKDPQAWAKANGARLDFSDDGVVATHRYSGESVRGESVADALNKLRHLTEPVELKDE